MRQRDLPPKIEPVAPEATPPAIAAPMPEPLLLEAGFAIEIARLLRPTSLSNSTTTKKIITKQKAI